MKRPGQKGIVDHDNAFFVGSPGEGMARMIMSNNRLTRLDNQELLFLCNPVSTGKKGLRIP